MNELTPIQARVLGCLMEKKETTPDQYPLSLNALRNACNQRSSRDPGMNCTEGEVGHAVRELEGMKLVSEVWGSRVPRYEHTVAKALGLALLLVFIVIYLFIGTIRATIIPAITIPISIIASFIVHRALLWTHWTLDLLAVH